MLVSLVDSHETGPRAGSFMSYEGLSFRDRIWLLDLWRNHWIPYPVLCERRR